MTSTIAFCPAPLAEKVSGVSYTPDVVDLRPGRESDEAGTGKMSQNKREYIRLNLNCRVFVELDGTAEPPTDSADVALCETLDVSYGGLKVSLDEQLVPGAIMPIGVELPWLGETLHLIGEIKWCRSNEIPGKAWNAGIQLLNSDQTDILQWRELLSHI